MTKPIRASLITVSVLFCIVAVGLLDVSPQIGAMRAFAGTFLIGLSAMLFGAALHD